MKRVLITDPLAEAGIALLREHCEVDLRPGLPADELLGIIGNYDALLVRSGTRVTADVLARGKRLAVVGRAGTGVDNVDLEAATRHGILVVNAPAANTVAVAEHTLALMLCLARNVCPADRAVHGGGWERQRYMGSELRGKTLGLVGLGRVGTAVAERARAFAMTLLAYDPFVSPERAARLNVELVPLDDLLARADYVSLHAPATEGTRGMIGARELGRMKPTARLINCARGDLIVEGDLVAALAEGRIAGAALDVYPDEPQVADALRRCGCALLTPHLGASTQEAQDAAAVDVAQQVADVLAGRAPRHPVNLPAISEEERASLAPFLDLARRLGLFYAQYARPASPHVEVTYGGELSEHDTTLLTGALLSGILARVSEEPVNLVNAHALARERGLEVTEVRTPEADGLAHLITLSSRTASEASGGALVAGAVLRGRPHIVRVGQFWYDLVAEGILLVSEHVEQPGVIGQVGTLLGEVGVSISFVQVGRIAPGGYGLMILGLDAPLPADGLARLLSLPSVRSARLVRL